MIRLVAVDLDDTLLDRSLKISPRAKTAIRSAVDLGVTVTIATGRMYCSAAPYARELNLDVPLITYNGALIKSGVSGETLFHCPVDAATTSGILAVCRERRWHAQLYLDDELYVRERDEKTLVYEQIAGITARELGDGFYSTAGESTKILIIADPAEVPHIRGYLTERFGEKISLAVSKPFFLEIVRNGVNKGKALDSLAGRLGVKTSEVMAVGDSGNDLDMLAYAGWSVAMGNASEAVKKAADAVTGANDADGVAEAIEKYVLYPARGKAGQTLK
ncbi:MAG TPA: Cof-type HAD-IIB family hydrolase [Selenomonadales bacterium]|nr:Cof-type HAD-IIB family hydrolase [Selenomonadales bacterium]